MTSDASLAFPLTVKRQDLVRFSRVLKASVMRARMTDAFNDGGSRLPALPRSTLVEERAHATRGATGALRGLPAHLHAIS